MRRLGPIPLRARGGVSALALAAAAVLAAGPPPAPAKRYPPVRAAALKAMLLERGSDPAAPSWALEYAGSPEVARLDPVARAAECAWAERIGLAAGPDGKQRKELRSALERVEGCPMDSTPIKRAAIGLTRIGVVVPLSGRYERYGKTLVNGLRLAIEEHNRDWSPTLSLVLYDSEGDPLVGARKSRWLLRDHGVSLLVGEIFSVNTAPLAAATQVVGAVLLSPSATNERLAELGDGVFQFHIGEEAMASALVRQVASARTAEGAPLSAGLLVAETPEDSVRAALFASACQAAKVKVAGTERVPADAVDLTKPLAALRGRKATALVLVGPPRLVGVAAPQLGSVSPGVRVYGFESLDPEGLNAEARSALEGATFIVADYVLMGAARDSFQTRYVRAYHEVPTRLSVRGYLTGLAITRSMEAGSITASTLKAALRNQVMDSREDRALRALDPVVPAEPEWLVVRGGRAVFPDSAAVDP
jgi:ABC-type branched-subunit amino acid transport system substrate-binding protein